MYRDQCSKTLYRTPLQPGWWLEGNQAMKSLKLLMFAALMVAMARALSLIPGIPIAHTKMTWGFLARALCAAGELLVLDEPVTGLDPAAAQDLYRTLDYLNKKEGIAIIMVTHDLHSALPYATAILHAGHGSWFYGDTASYLASPYGKRFGGEA